MTWFTVWDPISDGPDGGEAAWGVEADDAEDAADKYTQHGEDNSWWVVGDEPPDEVKVQSGPRGDGPIVTVDVVTEYERSFYCHARGETAGRDGEG